MNQSLKESLNINLSLKNQILLFALVPVIVSILVFTFITVSGSKLSVAVAIIISLIILFVSYLSISYFANRYINSPIERIIRKVSDTTAAIHSYTNKISEAVSEEATILSQQSAAVAEITSTTEELSASSSQIAEHAKSVVDVATKTWEDTKRGAISVETVIMTMGEINSDSQDTMNEIVELGKKSKEISKIMEIINNVADQTKLIAFNAALEAAGAGEAGRRFGVVAVEIRRLADSVMESTGEIEGKVNEIQEAINRLVIASEKASKVIKEGVDYSTETASVLIDVIDASQSTTDAAKQISLSTQQQKTASNQVVTALKEIVAGSGQTTHSINRISSISKELAVLSDDLRGFVEKFELRNDGTNKTKRNNNTL